MATCLFATDQQVTLLHQHAIKRHRLHMLHRVLTPAPPPCRPVQAFSCWLHTVVIRIFVESILRYGLPPAFQAAVIKPSDKGEAKLRAVLADTFGTSEWRALWPLLDAAMVLCDACSASAAAYRVPTWAPGQQ